MLQPPGWALLLSCSVMCCHAWMLTRGAALQFWRSAPWALLASAAQLICHAAG